MKHIVDSKERKQIHVSFPILETLVLHNLKNLEHICHGPLSITSFGSLSVIKVKNCIQLKYLFSYTMVKGLSHLSQIEVCDCNYMKEIVLEDINSSANNDIANEKIDFLLLRSLTLEHLETIDDFFCYYSTNSRSKEKFHGLEPNVSAPFFNAQVAFPNLDTLKLSSLLNLNKIWEDNYHSMYNLTSLIVDNCGGLKYLFSSTVVGSFKNLKHLEISNCAMMEEIITKEEGNSASEEVQFCKLEKIILKDMNNLKTIWHHQFETSKMLQVDNCNKIVVVFPSSMQKTYNELEMLEVTNCASVEEIFELNFNESSSIEDTTHLKEVTIDGLPKLKKIWSGDPQGILSFQNLMNVKVNSCASLEYLLPLSVATRCSHLNKLRIKCCKNMKEIVVEEKESIVDAAPIFEFNQLSSLLLWNLQILEGFFAKKHTLACPSLKEINVYGCPKLNLYRTLSTRSSNIQDDKLSISTQQPPFIAEEVIPNLEKLGITCREANMILQAQNSSGLFTKIKFLCLSDYEDEDIFPYWFLQNVLNLEILVVQNSCFKNIFQYEGRISEKTCTKIKQLSLDKLPNLEYICEEGFQNDLILEFLEYLWVYSCSSLINLLPSSVTFTHLVYLGIKDCNGLTKLITSSTAQSLIKLRTLKIEDCNSLEEILIGEENVHITFISLQALMLECLPSLNQFCSSKCFLKFPLLEFVIVRECPRMKVFSKGYTSTPNLRKVKNAKNDGEWFWKGNLNDTINNMFEDQEVKHSDALNETIVSSHLQDDK